MPSEVKEKYHLYCRYKPEQKKDSPAKEQPHPHLQENAITDYNKKGTLTRLFFSPIWSSGFVLSTGARLIERASKPQSQLKEAIHPDHKIDKNFLTNSFTACALIPTVALSSKLFGSDGAITSAVLLTNHGMLSLCLDAMNTSASNFPLPAMRAGMTEGRFFADKIIDKPPFTKDSGTPTQSMP